MSAYIVLDTEVLSRDDATVEVRWLKLEDGGWVVERLPASGQDEYYDSPKFSLAQTTYWAIIGEMYCEGWR